MHVICPLVPCVVQDAWVKNCVPLARFVVNQRDKAIKLIEEMEAVDKPTAMSFRCMESVIDPADYITVWKELDPSNGRPTVSRLKTVVTAVVRRRWWTWQILHPANRELFIHPTRSVFLPYVTHQPCYVATTGNSHL